MAKRTLRKFLKRKTLSCVELTQHYDSDDAMMARELAVDTKSANYIDKIRTKEN